jgi:hypothetical protein
MTDYKQLCVELLSELENAIRVIHAEDGTRNIGGAYAVINKVKNTLAETEPEDDADSIPPRKHRRPKPPSLKEQAMEALDDVSKMSETLYSSYDPPEEIYSDQVDIIRRALEALPDG